VQAQQKPRRPLQSPARSGLQLSQFRRAGVHRGARPITWCPPTTLSPKGTDIGINVFIDRALAGGWGKGDRLYMQGPWKTGAEPGLPAAAHARGSSIARHPRANAHCVKTYGKPFDKTRPRSSARRFCALAGGKVTSRTAAGARFWGMLYQNVMQGMFSDPIYGGNRDKAGWKLIGFPGCIACTTRTSRSSRQEVRRRTRRHLGHELRRTPWRRN
jgi:hypothetical protein